MQDANGGTTNFTYDSQNNMLTVQDARGITFLTNRYDSSGRVTQQTLANGGTYLFDWTTTQNTSEMFQVTDAARASAGGALTFRACSDCSVGYTPVVSQVDV